MTWMTTNAHLETDVFKIFFATITVDWSSRRWWNGYSTKYQNTFASNIFSQSCHKLSRKQFAILNLGQNCLSFHREITEFGMKLRKKKPN